MNVDMSEVVIEEIKGLKELFNYRLDNIDKQFVENKLEHNTISENQKYTNGKVRRFEVWKAGVVAGAAVIMFILVGIIIPLGNYYLQSSMSVEDQVDKAMSKYLEEVKQ